MLCVAPQVTYQTDIVLQPKVIKALSTSKPTSASTSVQTRLQSQTNLRTTHDEHDDGREVRLPVEMWVEVLKHLDGVSLNRCLMAQSLPFLIVRSDAKAESKVNDEQPDSEEQLEYPDYTHELSLAARSMHLWKEKLLADHSMRTRSEQPNWNEAYVDYTDTCRASPWPARYSVHQDLDVGYHFYRGITRVVCWDKRYNVPVVTQRRRASLYGGEQIRAMEIAKKVREEFVESPVWKHKHIVKVTHVWGCHDNSQAWMSEEMMAANLETYLIGAKKGLSEELVSYITRKVVKPLVHLHEHKQPYYKLRPSNIYIARDGAVKLAPPHVGFDFSLGQANVFHDDKMAHYRAPEVIRSNTTASATTASDVWSLGITLIALATGTAPLASNKKLMTLKYLIGSGSSSSTQSLTGSEFSAHLKSFVNTRCLQRDATYRATAEQLLKHPFLAMGRGKREAMAEFLRNEMSLFNPEWMNQWNRIKPDPKPAPVADASATQ